MINTFKKFDTTFTRVALLVSFFFSLSYSLLDNFYSKLELDLTSYSGTVSQVYWSKQRDSLSETRVISKNSDLPPGIKKHFSFNIGDANYEVLRLDPIDSATRIVIKKITLARGVTNYTWKSKSDFSQWAPLQNMSQYNPTDRGAILTPTSADNSIYIILPEKTLNIIPIVVCLLTGLLIIYGFHHDVYKIPANFKRIFYWLHTAILGGYFASLTYRCCEEFRVSYDYLFYHLPFALMRVNKTTYIPHDMLTTVFKGHPPLSHLVQGIFYLLTGSINSLQLNSAFGLVCLLLGVYFLNFSQFSYRWFLTAILAIPLVAIHYCSGLTDLIGACFIALAFASVLKFTLEPKLSLRTALSCVFACSCAMLIKFQTWPIIAIVVMLYGLEILRKLYREKTDLSKVIISLLLMGICTSFWPVRNFIMFGNPTFPFPMPIFTSYFSSGMSDPILDYNSIRSVTLPIELREHSNIYNFLHSVLELSRWQSDIPMGWSLDGGHPDGVKHIHNRLGGWFLVPIVTLSLVLLAASIRKNHLPISWIIAFVGATLLTASLPQSQELRYSLYIPITLALVFATSFEHLPRFMLNSAKFLIFGSMLWVMYKVPLYNFSTIEHRSMLELMPEEAKQFWTTEAHNPSASEVINVCGKTPFTIYWAGADLNTYRVKACF